MQPHHKSKKQDQPRDRACLAPVAPGEREHAPQQHERQGQLADGQRQRRQQQARPPALRPVNGQRQRQQQAGVELVDHPHARLERANRAEKDEEGRRHPLGRRCARAHGPQPAKDIGRQQQHGDYPPALRSPDAVAPGHGRQAYGDKGRGRVVVGPLLCHRRRIIVFACTDPRVDPRIELEIADRLFGMGGFAFCFRTAEAGGGKARPQERRQQQCENRHRRAARQAPQGPTQRVPPAERIARNAHARGLAFPAPMLNGRAPNSTAKRAPAA